MVKIAKKSRKRVKQSRKDMKQPDQFVEVTAKGAEWINNFRLQLLSVVGVLFLLALGVYLFYSISHNRAASVTGMLTETLKTYEGKIDKEAKAKDDSSTDTKTFVTKKDKYEASVKTIQTQLKKYPSHQASIFLKLYLANSYFELGLYDKAIAQYQGFI